MEETIACLQEENAILRGVLDILRVDLQIKDDQIDKVRKLGSSSDCEGDLN
jgi:hypothetical protein